MIRLGRALLAYSWSATVTIDATGGIPISPFLYGVNYIWDRVTEGEFPAYQAAITNVAHGSLSRYFGCWGAESYDWAVNTESTNKLGGITAKSTVNPRGPGRGSDFEIARLSSQ
jgi:hypothetical protein